MKIAVIGSGGVGGYFGGRLARAGLNVTFVARGEHLAALMQNGLSVKSIMGDFHLSQVKVCPSIADTGPVDLVLVCTKAWQIRDIRNDLKLIVHPQTVVLPLENGVLAADELAEAIDRSNIVGGLCRIISKIEAPGVINHLGVTPTIVLGELDKSRTQRLELIKETLGRAGIKVQISDDIEADVWRKFISICVSGLLAVTRTTYGELRELKETRRMMIELLTEVYQLSQRMGIRIEPDFVDKTVSFIDTFPYDSTSSLTRDVWEGKPSEIEYQNGTVVRLGEKYGVDTPINRFVYYSILPMELKARRVKP